MEEDVRSKARKVVENYLNKYSKTMNDLAQGPNGEYVHEIEGKLKLEIDKNKKLKQDNKELKELLRKMNYESKNRENRD